MTEEILVRVRESASKRYLFLPHAIKQMSHPDRLISSDDVENVVANGEVIEDYPEDARGHSCLMLGFEVDGAPLHVVCSPKEDYLAIITAYTPDPKRWSPDFRVRIV